MLSPESLRMNDREIRALKNEVGAYNVQNNFNREPQKDGLGRDEFLKLLTVQMSHQDPLSPMDSKDMIAQLAQFSSLEQMTQVNSTLESLTSYYAEQNSYAMLGRSVEFMDEAGNRFLGPVEMVMQNETGISLAVRTQHGLTTVNPSDVMMVHADGNLMASESASMIKDIDREAENLSDAMFKSSINPNNNYNEVGDAVSSNGKKMSDSLANIEIKSALSDNDHVIDTTSSNESDENSENLK